MTNLVSNIPSIATQKCELWLCSMYRKLNICFKCTHLCVHLKIYSHCVYFMNMTSTGWSVNCQHGAKLKAFSITLTSSPGLSVGGLSTTQPKQLTIQKIRQTNNLANSIDYQCIHHDLAQGIVMQNILVLKLRPLIFTSPWLR